jgi:DNA-binding response OmpR family regulator
MNSTQLTSQQNKLRPPKILVIEDDADVAQITQFLVKQYSGGRCDWADDSYVAMEALYKSHYDYIIVDQNLPGLKGLQVLQALDRAIDQDPTLNRETRFLHLIPVLFMSGASIAIPKDFKLKYFVIQDAFEKNILGLGLARNLAS